MYLRNFQGLVEALAATGHHVAISTSPHDLKIPDELRQLARKLEHPYRGISFGLTHERADWWAPSSRLVRNIANLLHYRRPEYKNAPALTARAERRAGLVPRLLFPRALCSMPRAARILRAAVRFLNAGIPPDKKIVRELRDTRVDALILTPMVDLETEQIEWVRAARAERIPTCLLVASWDNLTNKGLIQIPPDRVVVWNEFQKHEAVTLHEIAAENVIVTGAQLYDEWFKRKPSRMYEEFCKEFGFDASRPTILYCGSSIFIARDEVVFVREWIERIRHASDDRLRTANILVRPHPMHQVPFDELDVSSYERVTVHPRSGGMPVVETNKADFFDSLFHAALVVGINTSALIEAAICGKRSFTVADARYSSTQEGTLHFHYLISGGILQKASNFEEHFEQLTRELQFKNDGSRLRKFLEVFVRPRGLDKPATPIIAEEVSSLPNIKPHLPPNGLVRISARVVVTPIAVLAWIPERAKPALLNILTRVLRFGLFNIARMRRCDTVSLIARRTPLDYARIPISILVTSPRENLMRTRSVMSEPWTLHWLESVVKPGEVLYDVGANVGAFSLVAAKTHDQAVRIFAFEPSFVTYAALCRNIMENQCEKSITPVPLPLMEDTAISVFKYRSLVPGATEHALGSQALASKDFKETKPAYQQRMIGMTIDTLTRNFGLESPNHIKVDVDGSELGVLRGASMTLATGGVRTILVDARDDRNSSYLTDYLRQLGFTLAAKFNGAEEPGFHAIFARDAELIGAIMAECRVAEPSDATVGQDAG
jgi:FkbM family methyltransferase